MVALSPIAPPPSAPAKKPLYLSASRIETFLTCSQLYAAKYLAKLPDAGNDGSARGNVCHYTLEPLLNPRHRKLYDAAIKAGTCAAVPALWRLIEWHARREGVHDGENLEMIDAFIMVALRNEFYGPPGTVERIAEQEFNIQVNEPDGRRYNVRGFIDKTFKVQDEEGLILIITDYKGSKAKFQGEKATFNGQKIIYELAARRLYPEITRRKFRFLFMKFPRAPYQEEPPMSEEQLSGYEWVLTDLQSEMERFTEANVGDRLAAYDEEKQWLCGKEGFKKDGSPAWICTARRPMDYWVIVDGEGNHVTSGFTEDELGPKLDPTKGHRIEPRHWAGCCAFKQRRGLS